MGVNGSYHQVIVPREKQVLFWPGAAHPVKSVKGQRPNPFLKRALEQVIPEVPALVENVVRPELAKALQENLQDVEVRIIL